MERCSINLGTSFQLCQYAGMARTQKPTPRRDASLSRESIVDASIELLDASGEAGLTFRALAERLATGAGAIYWHVANKSDLLTAACDAVVARTLDASPEAKTPAASIRAVALGMFDAIDTHPWVGAALNQAPGKLPIVRILERIGQQLQALGVPKRAQWSTASALLHYILGVAGQNAANAQSGRAMEADREAMLESVAGEWLALDPADYPFTRSMAATLSTHDDRADFVAGIDLILSGLSRS
ncbi:TetR family transcriptional regulator [Bacillus sp. NP157]|nr:TetR family transcriptional regulator [Bacillus sp. NP157]